MKKKPAAPSGKKKVDDTGFRPFAALKSIRDELAAESNKAETPKKTAARVPDKVPPSTVEDEALSLHRLMSGVTPLSGKAARIPRSQDKLLASDLHAKRLLAEGPVEDEAEAVHAHLRALVEGGRFELVDDGRRVEGHRQGVTADVVRKLRRGILPIDARLDLHGQKAAEAQKVLAEFLGVQRRKGERCVLIVHGKGEHSPGGVGILRGEMAAWLSQGGASVHVAAFATAQNDDGGEGAVYVLLTR